LLPALSTGAGFRAVPVLLLISGLNNSYKNNHQQRVNFKLLLVYLMQCSSNKANTGQSFVAALQNNTTDIWAGITPNF
jgi:hypothetical protein